MQKEVPVYDICKLSQPGTAQDGLIAERLGDYLQRHPASLHLPHGHSFYHMVLFTQGGGTHSIDFRSFKVKPFEIYFMAPGQVHSWHFTGKVDGYIINFSSDFFAGFLLQPDYLERFSFFNGTSADSVYGLKAPQRDKVTALLAEIVQLTENKETGNTDMIRTLLLQVFFVTETGVKKTAANNIPAHTLTVLKNFRRLINQHYKTMRLPKEYAELLYITPNHLNALCRELVDKTAGDMIRDRVLLEAKRLLTNAGMNIAEIAYSLNFKDNSYFARFFKKYEGVTPEDFRKQFTAHQ